MGCCASCIIRRRLKLWIQMTNCNQRTDGPGAVAAGKQKPEKQAQETQELVKEQNVLLQQQNTVLTETLSRLEESIRNLSGPGGCSWGRYGTQNNQKLFDPYPGDRWRFSKYLAATSSVDRFHCHETGHWACACPKKQNQDEAGTSGNHVN